MIVNVLTVIGEKVEAIIRPIMDASGVVLVDLNVQRRSRDIYIQIIADHIHGGITLDECMKLNRELSSKIEAAGLIEEGFNLELSSPGLDRPLRNVSDFRRVLNRKIRVHLSEKIQEKIEYTGKVVDVNEENVVIETENGEVSIPHKVINKGMQIIDEM